MMRLKAPQSVNKMICGAFSSSTVNYQKLKKGIWRTRMLALLGETRVLSVDSAPSLNNTHAPPVPGALGKIGL